jgi:hypothetical protein
VRTAYFTGGAFSRRRRVTPQVVERAPIKKFEMVIFTTYESTFVELNVLFFSASLLPAMV